MPSNKQAMPVKISAGQILFSDKDIIKEVSFTPKPVIDNTPIIIEAHIIIEPIREICRPEAIQASKNLLTPNLKLKKFFILKNSNIKADKIDIDAEYWGVKPANIRQSNIENGIKKNNEVKITVLISGRLSFFIGFKL